MLLTIPEFIKKLPRPRSEETIRRWIRAGKIKPLPVKFGKEYLIQSNATYTDSSNNLIGRIKNGTEKKS